MKTAWLGPLLLSTLTFAACADDGNVIGSDTGGSAAKNGGNPSAGTGHAGSATTAGQGGNAPSAGTTQGGDAPSAGSAEGGSSGSAGATPAGGMTSSAGTTNNGGQSGAGAASCEMGQCARANYCQNRCGGELTYIGCCACMAPAVERSTCAPGNGGACVGVTCGAGETCVAYRTVGGAVVPPDMNGDCETGRHIEGRNCVADFSYACAAVTGCSTLSATCRCAAGSACASANACALPATVTWLDGDADLMCEQQVP